LLRMDLLPPRAVMMATFKVSPLGEERNRFAYGF
jgi:hypothetical protein